MSLPRILPKNRNAETDQSSLATHTLSGRDFATLPDGTESSLTGTLGVANYIYYRIYAEDGAIPSKTPAAPGDPFLGRIKARSVPPPHTAKAVKRSIARVEDIKDPTRTSLFLTPHSQSHMGDADKVTILNRTGPGSTPQEPLALVATMSDSERSALESGGTRRGGLASAESNATSPEIRYLYYLLYAKDYEMPSKVAIDPEEPCLGRIRADSVAPPHGPASIKRCISRVERTPALAHANLFADISCDTPLEEDHISILRTDGPGMSPNKPMAIVQVECPIPDGKYVIKNRAADIFWNTMSTGIPITTVHFWPATIVQAKNPGNYAQWDITHVTNGNISISSPHAPSSWVGANITGSTVPVPWRLIPADGKFYYLTVTTNMNRPRLSQNHPRVPAAQPDMVQKILPGLMATLQKGDQWQMWEFIRI